MDYYLLTLRLVHIVFGAVWAGTVIAFALFVIPTANRMGPDGGKFMQNLTKQARFPQRVAQMAILTLVSGVFLMFELSNGFSSAWMGSRYGILMSTGGLVAIIAFMVGITTNVPNSKKLASIGDKIAASGAAPTGDQLTQIGMLRAKLTKGTNILAVLLGLALAMMATARYMTSA